MPSRLEMIHLACFSVLQTHVSMCSFQNDSKNFKSQIKYMMKLNWKPAWLILLKSFGGGVFSQRSCLS